MKQDKIRLESEKQNLEGVVSLLQEDIIKLHKKLNTAIDTIQKRDEVRQLCDFHCFSIQGQLMCTNRRSHVFNAHLKPSVWS